MPVLPAHCRTLRRIRWAVWAETTRMADSDGTTRMAGLVCTTRMADSGSAELPPSPILLLHHDLKPEHRPGARSMNLEAAPRSPAGPEFLQAGMHAARPGRARRARSAAARTQRGKTPSGDSVQRRRSRPVGGRARRFTRFRGLLRLGQRRRPRPGQRRRPRPPRPSIRRQRDSGGARQVTRIDGSDCGVARRLIRPGRNGPPNTVANRSSTLALRIHQEGGGGEDSDELPLPGEAPPKRNPAGLRQSPQLGP